MIDEPLKFSSFITSLPIVHGSGDFALEVRRIMLEEKFDCLAVPLPPSFQPHVEEAIQQLPAITMVTQESASWSGNDSANGENDSGTVSYVPIDPCQGVIVALKIAIQERIPRVFIDLETDPFESFSASFPDPYALKKVSIARFASAVLPAVPPPSGGQTVDRIDTMGARLRELEKRFRSILFVCSLTDWPWIRNAYRDKNIVQVKDDPIEPTRIFQPQANTLFFILGELPFITALYERAGRRIEDDENLTINGIKELLFEARKRYKKNNKFLTADLSPKMLSTYLKYVRNLSLIEDRLTPDLYTLCVAAQQIAGDGFALELVETSREYAYQQDLKYPEITCGINKIRMVDGRIMKALNRLPGPPVSWGKLKLKPRPLKIDQRKWRFHWNPFGQCSHLPEDKAIERFRSHVIDRARNIIGIDLVHSEKFTTSLKDGLDIRETLRHFYSNDLYVKVNPPVRGDLDCVVMLFDSPADPRKYPWRTTWFAEHEEESTLCFFATNYLENLVGPGIACAQYGGALLIFPPVSIPDIWTDHRLDFTDTLEERLLVASCIYSRNKNIALLSYTPPGAIWRKLARQFGKTFVHLPMSGFSATFIRQLQIFHVLNGKQIRSYADYFIRKA